MKTSPTLVLVFMSAVVYGLVAAPQTYIPVFTGMSQHLSLDKNDIFVRAVPGKD